MFRRFFLFSLFFFPTVFSMAAAISNQSGGADYNGVPLRVSSESSKISPDLNLNPNPNPSFGPSSNSSSSSKPSSNSPAKSHSNPNSLSRAPQFVLEPVIVEASKWQPAMEFANSQKNLITGKDLGNGTPQTLGEALDGELGLSVPTLGGTGRAASPVLGGFTGPRVRVLWDGLPLNDPITGDPDLGELDPAILAGAEIAHGAGSGIWTSGGAGGLINFTSRDPSLSTFRLVSDGLGGQGQSFTLGKEIGMGRFGINAGRFQTPGISAADSKNGNPESDGFSRERFGMNFSGNIKENLKFSFRGNWQRSITDLDGYSAKLNLPVDDDTFQQRRDMSRWVFDLTSPDSNGEWKFYFGNQRIGMAGVKAADLYSNYDFFTFIRKQALDRSGYESWGEWTVGIERQETEACNSGLYTRSETEGALRAGVMAPIAKGWRLHGIFRRERPPMKNEHWVDTGRIALVKERAEGDIRISWGRAFRTPTMNERFYPGFGDPGLLPEDARTWSIEAAKRWWRNKLELSGSARDTLATNLISTTSTSDPAYPYGMKAANVDQARVRTHSFALRSQTSDTGKLSAEMEIIDCAKNNTTGTMLPRVPGKQFFASFEQTINRTVFLLRHRLWGEQWDDASNVRSLSGTGRWDLNISKKFGKTSGVISFLNLLNNRDERILGYGEPGRRVAASLEFDLD
ncbi:MAG: TonB-dependent receptor [Candidatus Riflebacteria bacterium]|nr:TonB-dependent receptor [Candidatus Riflebacteria bacterium]